ncbi:hypothetical protein [Actinokineospora sp. HUAS TT18]|uniref:hypothetical protein n=1 Tax=Actinokineospora sp. HUAS TT18 TaxID=3447451 RepID=UPI003F51E12A
MTELVTAVKAAVGVLQANGCLPDVPPGEGTELTSCHSFTAALLSHVHGAVADVTTASEIDLDSVGDHAEGAVEALDGLIADACVPDEEPPLEPPLP